VRDGHVPSHGRLACRQLVGNPAKGISCPLAPFHVLTNFVGLSHEALTLMRYTDIMSTSSTTTQTYSDVTKGHEMESKDMTGYAIAREVNKVLETLSLATIKPQMVYNYINNNLIPSYVSEGGQTLVKREDALKWIKKYSDAKKARQNAQ
jgi:hypothetical protein